MKKHYFTGGYWLTWAGRMKVAEAVEVASLDHAHRMEEALRKAKKRSYMWKHRMGSRWLVTCLSVAGGVAEAICQPCLRGGHEGCRKGEVEGKRSPVECVCRCGRKAHGPVALLMTGDKRDESAAVQIRRAREKLQVVAQFAGEDVRRKLARAGVVLSEQGPGEEPGEAT